jgi:hypothetical protein
MEKYGINNVRGGSFCEIKLSDNNITTLKQMIAGTTDKCYICGKNDHFANECKKDSAKKEQMPTININEKCDCPTSLFKSHRRCKCMLNKIISFFDDENEDIDKLIITEELDDEELDDEDDEDNDELDELLVDNDLCFRCYRRGHYVADCYAKTTIAGDCIQEELEVFSCDYCGKEFDTLKSATCHENLHCKKYNNKNANNVVICYKCGRKGHYSNGCYASKHIKGYFI